MIGKGLLHEQIKHQLFGIVLGAGDFLHDHVFFTFQFVIVKQRIGNNIAKNVQGQR